MNEPCVFCNILTASTDAVSDHDRILYSSRHFVLLPALGALVPGHVLAVSKAHILSLAAMGSRIVDEYEELVVGYRQQLRLRSTDLLEAEHGAVPTNRGGSCIEHVHVNLIPGVSHCANVLDSVLPSIPGISSLPHLATLAQRPYAFTRTHMTLRVYDASSAPSQLIRRRVCERLGRDDWDWSLFPHHEYIKATLAMWSSHA